MGRIVMWHTAGERAIFRCVLHPVVAFARMLSLDDSRWTAMCAGYRVPFDPRPLFSKLESGEDAAAVWHELWGELHHQGDVGEASYAAVPHLVRIHRQRKFSAWDTYALVAIIELSRAQDSNPDVPEWLAESYFRAIVELGEIGVTEVMVCRRIWTRSVQSSVSSPSRKNPDPWGLSCQVFRR